MMRRCAWLAAARAAKGCNITSAEVAAMPPRSERRVMGWRARSDDMGTPSDEACSVFKNDRVEAIAEESITKMTGP
ncbi:MAG: hypothetical protein DI627_17010 [Acinetobacter sp.]|nr:MAG: hypothetical protein DI627_17010 [Acinetobacter sp.]